MICPNCHQPPEVEHLHWRAGVHFCHKLNCYLFCNGEEWTTSNKLKAQQRRPTNLSVFRQDLEAVILPFRRRVWRTPQGAA